MDETSYKAESVSSRDGKQPSEIHHKEYGANATQNCMIVADRLQTPGKANTSVSILRFIDEPAADVPREKIAFSRGAGK